MEGIALESFIVSPLLEGCRDWEPFYFSFFCLPPDFHRDRRPEKSFFTFFLDKKSNKKNQVKSKGSAAFAMAHAQVAELFAWRCTMTRCFGAIPVPTSRNKHRLNVMAKVRKY